MQIEQVHEAALLLNRLACLWNSVDRQVHPDDGTPEDIAERMNTLYQSLPDQKATKEQ